MAVGDYKRSPNKFKNVTSGGPYEAVVVSHLDRKYSGSLEVEILRYTGAGSSPERSGQLLTVRYLSPFYGVTPSRGIIPEDGYQNTQKSYGMWMVPPDVGTRVLVIFAEGNPNFGYWIGCIQDDYMNFMVPDGRASTSNTTGDTPDNLSGVKLPVGEYNKAIETGEKVDPTLFSKPYNKDFTNILEVQGLLLDEIRGTTTSSARREIPSSVFGISTPGPVDKRRNAPKYAAGARGQKANIFSSRLGGSSFVMDDGDDKYVRATHAEDGPPFYINKEVGEDGGDETIPQNELIRLRTRTGHQILLHNSEDLIYIGNSRGTAWIELTSDGKIDIHAQDSISVMSDVDINFTAERDFNIDAGRNINLKASARWSDGEPFYGQRESGRIQLESAYDTNHHVGKNYTLTVLSSSNTHVGHDKFVTTVGDYNLHSQSNIYQRSEDTTHHSSGSNFYRFSQAEIHDKAASDIFINSGGKVDVVVSDALTASVGSNISMDSGGDVSIISSGLTKNRAGGGIEQFSGAHWGVQTSGESNIKVGADLKITASGTSNLKATEIFNDSDGNINLAAGGMIAGDGSGVAFQSGQSAGGSEAGDVTPASFKPASIATESDRPSDAAKAKPLPTITLPYVLPGAAKSIPYDSILTRSPQHEPWPHHENMNPLAFKRNETDRENPGMLPLADRIVTPDTFQKSLDQFTSSRIVLRSNSNEYFTGTTGDGMIGIQDDTSYQFDPTGDEGALVEVQTSTGLKTQVAEIFKENFQGFIDDLEATGYEIKRLGGYAKRKTVGNSGSWSLHASGAAIDINWPNPIVGGYPNGYFSPRPLEAPMTDMPPNTAELAKKNGLGWGGAWNSIDDAMHFSAHKAEGGAYEFPRNGMIPKGPSNEPTFPVREDEQQDEEPSNVNPDNKPPGPQESERSDANQDPEGE